MSAERFLASAVKALVDAVGSRYAVVLAPALDGDPDALAVLVTFAKAVRLIADDAAETQVHLMLRQLLDELAALREPARRRASA